MRGFTLNRRSEQAAPRITTASAAAIAHARAVPLVLRTLDARFPIRIAIRPIRPRTGIRAEAIAPAVLPPIHRC